MRKPSRLDDPAKARVTPAPPVYRPVPGQPGVTQARPRQTGLNSLNSGAPPAYRPGASAPAGAPPVYRPNATRPAIAQARPGQAGLNPHPPGAPPVYRPSAAQPHIVQARPALPALNTRASAAPAAYRPAHAQARILQARETPLRPSPVRAVVIQRRTKSDTTLTNLIPGIKTHIKSSVKSAFKETKEVQPQDSVARQLLPAESRNCAAVMEIDDDKVLVAFNSNQVGKTQQYFSKPVGPYENEKLSFSSVDDTNCNKHAEMKILDYLWDNRGTVTYGSYIGITQACCMLCAGAMVATGHKGDVLGYHTKAVTNWVAPRAISLDRDNLKSFLGNTAFQEVKDDQSDIDRLLQLLSQNHNNWD